MCHCSRRWRGGTCWAQFSSALSPSWVGFAWFQNDRVVQLLVIGGCGQALITYLSLHALEYIPVGPLAFLFYTYPAWVALVGALRKTERLTSVRVIALTLALAGVTIMVGAPTGRLNPMGVMLALASALLYSAYLPALEHVQAGIPAVIATFLLIVGAAVAFLLAALLQASCSSLLALMCGRRFSYLPWSRRSSHS